MDPRNLIRLFAVVAIAEAVSWAGLLAGMYAKYVTETGEAGVQVFGPIHGGIFIAYVALAVAVARVLRWGPWVTAAALVCAVPPFATALFELWLVRTGRLDLARRPAGAES